MKKIFGLANVVAIELPDNLRDANDEREACDIRIVFKYSAEALGHDKDANDFELDDELSELVDAQAANDRFSYLWDATKNGYNSDTQDKAVSFLEKKLVGKNLPFTTYICQVSEILDGSRYVKKDGTAYTSVHNDTRGFSSFSNSYLKNYDNEEAVLDSFKNRILRNLEENDLKVGRTDEEDTELRKRLKAARKAAEKDED